MKRSSLLTTIVAVPVLLTACGAPVENQSIDGPDVTMDVPPTLSGVADSGATAKPASLALLKTVNRATTSSTCSSKLSEDVSNRFTENGYYMTKFLVGLSQSVSCSSDAIIGALLSNAKPMINAGMQSLDIDPNAVDPITHMNVVEDTTTVPGETTYKVWLYWGGDYTAAQVAAGVGVKKIYLSWTSSSAGMTGQLMWVDLDQAGTGGMDNMRIDFIRQADLEQNDIYLQFSTGVDNADKVQGFRARVAKNIAADGTVDFVAKGRMALSGQIMPNLDSYAGSGATYSPNPFFVVNAISDAPGKGAAVAEFSDFAFALADATSGVDFGPYEYSIQDKGYFNADGTMTWRNKNVTEAWHKGAGNRNSAATTQYAALDTALSLGGSYFSSAGTCNDTDNSDCQTFIQAMFDQGIFDPGNAYNDGTAEPVDSGADTRPSELAALGDQAADYLDSIFVSVGDDGTTTYDVPIQ